MKLINFLRKKSIYILFNLLIFMLGYLFIREGFVRDITDKMNPIFISIGTSLIASGIVIVLDLWKQISISNIFDRINNVLYKSGIQRVFEKRDLDKYDNLMKGLKNELDICGYSLVAFFDSYSEVLLKKAKDNPGLIIRILVVNPESHFSQHRAMLEGNKCDDYLNRINRLKNEFDKCAVIQMRKIDAPLSTMIFRIDDTMFIGPHFYKKTSKSTVTIELSKDGLLYHEYLGEFNRMWVGSDNL